MCGICGELRFDNYTPDLNSLSDMMASFARRGPDDFGHVIQGAIGLGHRRLAVIDLSNRAHQPLVDEMLGLSLVFNGTIYNYRDLRHQLRAKGYTFHSEGDTEVILKAYAEWGEDCVTYLHGMFAFGLWDSHQQQLLLARDRFGIGCF
jgi:asparagine synthase (glutamine-hydrolysing)